MSLKVEKKAGEGLGSFLITASLMGVRSWFLFDMSKRAKINRQDSTHLEYFDDNSSNKQGGEEGCSSWKRERTPRGLCVSSRDLERVGEHWRRGRAEPWR